MKVVAFNGSPHEKGNTYEALKMVTKALEEEGTKTEIIHVGDKLIRGCTGCGACIKMRNERCAWEEDEVNEWIQKMKEADGILLGSPVHFASISAPMKAFLDRAFYVASFNGNMFRHKVAAPVVAVRRSGGVNAVDTLSHYIQYAEMLMPTSNYWNVIHGTRQGEVVQDAEGMQILYVLGKNMGWLLHIVENGRNAVEAPPLRKKVFTNFIR